MERFYFIFILSLTAALSLSSCSLNSKKDFQIDWPSSIHKISRGYSGSHDGIDFALPVNTPVYAAHEGKVFEAGSSATFGKYIILEFSSTWASLYAHLNKLLVKKGETVQKKQKIALSGSTGASQGPHLHFEVFKNKKNVNPKHYLPDSD